MKPLASRRKCFQRLLVQLIFFCPNEMSTDMHWIKQIMFVLQAIAFRVECEWIEIPQTSEQISERKLSIENSMVPSDGFEVKDLNQLKYEELADIIGPGFEDEFSKFLKRHSHEINSNADEQSSANQSIYVDPWLKYDHTSPFITSKRLWTDSNSSFDYTKNTTTTTFVPSVSLRKNSKTKNREKDGTNKLAPNNISEINNKTSAIRISNSTNKPIPNRKTNRIKWMPYNSPFNFNEILNFLRSIKNSFSMHTARGVTAKIDKLKKFKAELMRNIGN